MITPGKGNIFSKLKQRWHITSNLQLLLILVVFSITGSASLVVKKWVTTLLGIPQDIHFIYKILLFIFITFPAYQLLLLGFAFLFGQFQFFLAFQKKSIGRIFCKKRTEKK
jgi:ferrochelatase